MLDIILWVVLVVITMSCCFFCELNVFYAERTVCKKVGAAGEAPATTSGTGGVTQVAGAGADVEAGGSVSVASMTEEEKEERRKVRDEESVMLRLSTRAMRVPGETKAACNMTGCCAKFFSTFIGSYILLLMILRGYVGAFRQSLIYEPITATQCGEAVSKPEYECDYNPVGLNQTDVEFKAGSTMLHGWMMTSDADVIAAKGAAVPILYNHGSGRNIAVKYRVERYKFLLEQGVTLLTYDYPGYGKSHGIPSEPSLYFSAVAAYDYFVKQPGVNSSYVVGLGRSLGGAVLSHASDFREFKGLIMQSTFNNMGEVAGAGLSIAGWVVSSSFSSVFQSDEDIKTYSGCVFMSISKDDEVVPFSSGEKLYAAAGSKNPDCSEFVETSVAVHDDPMTDKEKTALAAWIADQRARMLS